MGAAQEALHAELEQWVEKLRAMEPHSKRIGDLGELDKLLDRLDALAGPGAAGRWYQEHSADISRVLVPMSTYNT